MLKRMTAWILVVALLASVLPMGIAAETETTYPAQHSHSATQHDCAHCDDTITWEAWGDTDDEKKALPKTSGHYYLVSDITKTGRTEMEATADIVLCLNGYTVDGNNTDTIYRVVTSGKLRIDDCTAYTDAGGVYHAGKFINGKTTGGVGGTFYVNGTSTLTMTAGIISGSKNERTTTDTGYGGGALHLREKAQVTLENVVFENCSTTKDGGIISKRDSGSKLTAKNCTFKGSTATTQGGAAYITGGGGASFEKCTFTGNTANTGSALYLHTAGTVTLKDCVFEKNTTNGGASGVLYVYRSDVSLDGCIIKDNTAKGNGGSAIYMTHAKDDTNGSNVTVKDCTITGNKFTGTATSARGAIYVTKVEDKLTVVGKTVIEGNYAATDGTPVERGIFLQDSPNSVDVGGLTDGAKITIRTNKDQTTTNMVTAATAPTNWSRAWVVYENNGMAVAYDAENGFYFAVYTDHIHCECGNSACTDAAHKKVEYIAWNDATALPTFGNYYLNTDVTLAKETSVNADLNLCLNGHVVTAAKDKRHLSTPTNGVLTVTIADCTAQTVDGVYKAGKFIGGVDVGSGQGGGAIYIRTGGTLKIYDGIFEGNTSITGGGAINTLANTTLIIYDGLFSGNTAVTTDGKSWKNGGAVRTLGNDAQILGGTFTGNKGAQGGAIYSESAKFVVKDAVIADNYAYSNAGGIYAKKADTTITNTTFTGNYGTKDGGALYYREGKIDITDCVFTDNECKTIGAGISFSGNAVATITGGTFENNETTSGGAVVAQGGASVTVTGGTYKNNTVTTYGGAFSLYNGHLTIDGGSQITGNTAKRGGAIDLRETSTLVLKDCTITGNTASSGGAVYVNDKSSASLEGAPQIMANQGGNLHLMDANPIQIGALTDQANVCVAGNPGAFTEACDDYSKYFAADSKYLKVEYVDGAMHLVAGGEHKHCLCSSGATSHCTHTNIAWVAWEGTTSLPTSGSYYLLYDVQLSDEASISKDLNLCLNGHTVTAAEGKRILSTPTGAKATISITDCTAATVDGVYTAGKLTGGRDLESNVGGGAIYLRAGGNLNFYEGIVTGNDAVAGGAMLVTTNTVTNIFGGEFSGNKAYEGETVKPGGAIYAMKGAEVNILGGTFKNNSGSQGGAIFISDKSVLTVSGGNFADNTATLNGAAIYGKVADVTISGGTFTGNVSGKDGGAIYYREGNMDITGDVLITGNESKTVGGGVCYSGKATGTISGGIIENNTANSGGGMILQGEANVQITGGVIRDNTAAKEYGGGAYLYKATLTVTGGTISGNTAPKRGGGICAENDSALYINGGVIEGNHSDVNGGGVYAKVTDMKITGGQIINNTSLKDGAGVYYREGNMDISGDVLISGNETKTAGGGVCYSGKATGTISGGAIEKNKAASGAGMIVQGEANVTMKDGSVRKNAASSQGGGVYVHNSTFTMTGGTVTGNSAKVGGGGFYVNQKGAKVVIDGGTVSKNSTKNGGGFLVVNLATLELKSGKITGNTTQKGSGGGAYISTNSFFKMSGGSVSGNVVTGAGAGLYGLRSTLTISGGSISGNTANGAGGAGIYLNGATLRASGVSITGNTTKGNGGGIASTRNIVKKNGVETASYSCNITLSGCYIANNSAKIAGGVIMNGNGGKLEMYSTTITGNKATNQAGGLYISAKCTGTIKNSNISNNACEKTGGGVYLNKLSEVTFTDCKLHNNTSGTAGGAIYIYRRSTSEYTGCSFVGNTAGTVAGGVYADGNSDYDSVTTFTDCVFDSNTAGTRGGAFYGAMQNEFTAIRCTFTNNTAVGTETLTGNGGAIAVRDIAYLEDCTFTGNKAEFGGAFYGGNMEHPLYHVNGWGYKGSDVSVDIINCTFTDNDATRNGGAIFNAMSSFATLQNVTITGNTAGEQGSGIYAEEDLTLQDVTITGNVSGNNGHALFLADSEYDGQTYIRGLFKFGGDIIITDNEGGNLYLDNQVTLNATYEGFGPKTHMDVVLDKGVLTQRVYGAYNYEGGNQVYTITYGDRSLTDPEIDESLIQEDTAAEQTDDGKAAAQDTWLYVGVSVIAVAILAVVALLLLKKKKAGKPAEASKE